MLSNTATPRYYAEFRDKVLAGEIPVCEEISLEMNRIDRLIANPTVYYDDRAIDGFVAFVEGEMTKTDGSDIHLLDSFKLWAEQLLSWFVYVDRSIWNPHEKRFVVTRIKKRLRDTQYLIVARGSAKSMYAAFLQAYFLTVDTSTTHQVTVAPTMKQAEEVLSPIRTAITRARGPLFKFLTDGSMQNTTGARSGRQKLAPTKKGIENFLTDSILEIRPMTIDKVQGLRSKINTIDEWLSGDTRENVITALKQGAAKFEDPIVVAISSEGTVRNGVGDTIKMELGSILKGETVQDHVSIFHYKLDNVEEVGKPETWLKCNPNLGLTISYETYHQDVERAENFPAVRNEILAKRFGLPMEGYTYFFTYEETIPHPPVSYDGLPCSLGIDLSRGDDFCAFSFLYPLRADESGFYEFGVTTQSYITRRTLELLPGATRAKYEEFLAEGTLIIMEGAVLDMMDVYDSVSAHMIQHDFDVRSVGYDPYNAKAFMERYEREWGSYGVSKVIQGARTESVPLGELKILAADRSLKFHEKLMQYTMGNAVTWEDTNGNRKLMKRRSDEKIDNVAALMDAYVAFKENLELYD
ncbi:terminase [Candidatus Dependentiae bacterium]|nr:MAG: terminase [Candidatus Dependentiae bacterium]